MRNNYQKQLKITAISTIMLIVLLFPVSVLKAQITATTPATRCGAGIVTLRATGAGTIKWYDVPFYGTPIPSGVEATEGGSTFTTPSLEVTKTYYADALDATNCSINTGKARIPVVATISASAMQASIYYSSATFCKTISGSQAITLTGTSGGSFIIAPSSGLSFNNTIGDAARGSILPSSSAVGTYTVTYTAPATEGCTESPAVTTVSIATAPAAPEFDYAGGTTMGENRYKTYCSSNVPVSVHWTTESAGGSFSSSPTGLTLASNGTFTPQTSSTGVYTVTYSVPGGGGCAPQTASVTLAILRLPTTAISYSAATYTKNDVAKSISLTGTGAYTGGTFSYIVSGTPGTVYSTGTGPLTIDAEGTITPVTSTAGIYIVSYSLNLVSPCGTPTVATTTVTIYGLPTAAISGTTSICNSASTSLSIDLAGTGPWTFTYTDGTTPVTITSTSTDPYIQSVAPTSNTTYTLTAVSDSHATGTVSGSAVITVNEQPAATFSYAGSPYCTSGSNPFPSYTGSAVAGNFTSTNGLVFVSDGTGEINITNSTPGTYTVRNTVSPPAGCISTYAEASVTITKLPVATFTYSGNPYCRNSSDPSPSFSGDATAYSEVGAFSSSTGLVINTETGLVDLSASEPGTYRVTKVISAATGCETVTATFDLTINEAPVQPAISYEGGASFCQSSPLQPVTQTGTAGGIYTASTGLTVNSVTGEINPSTSTAGGPYTVTYTIAAAGGCSVLTATTPITILLQPTATISYTGTPFCKSVTSAPVTLTGSEGGTYTCTDTHLSLDASTGTINPSLSDPGEYSITYTIAAAGGCAEVIAVTTVNITTLPAVTISYDAAYCKSLTDPQAVTLSGTAGGTFTATTTPVTDPVSVLSIDAVTGAITPSTSSAGIYTVTYTIAASQGCAAIPATAQVTINALPTPAITGAAAVCKNSTGNIYSTPFVEGRAYTWYVMGGAYVGDPTTNELNVTWSGDAGTVTVEETITATGCMGSAVLNVVINPRPTASIAGATTVCLNATSPLVTFTGAGGTRPYTFTYNINGATNTTVTTTSESNSVTVSAPATTAGAFTYNLVGVTDGSSTACYQAQSGSELITVRPQFTPGAILTTGQTICSGGDPTTIGNSTLASGGDASITYKWESSLDGFVTAGSVIAEAPSSTYDPPSGLTATTSYRRYAHDGTCNTTFEVSTGTWLVTVNELPTITAQPASPTAVCAGTGTPTFSVTATGTGLAYKWQEYVSDWSDISNTGVYTGATTATLTITSPPIGMNNNKYRCVVSGTCTPTVTTNGDATLTVNPVATISLSSANATQTVSVSIPLTNITYSVTGGGTGATVTGLPAGVVGAFSGGVFTISGTPSVNTAQAYNYTVNTTGTCAQAQATGTISVTAATHNSAADQTICYGTQPQGLTLVDYTGSVVKWQKSSNDTFNPSTDIANATTSLSSSDMGTLTSSTYFRAVVQSGICDVAYSSDILVTVNPLPGPSFTAQPGAIATALTNVTYTTESGKSDYVWTYTGGDYTIVSGGGNTNSVTLQWSTVGARTVTVNYSNSTGCSASYPASAITTVGGTAPLVGATFGGGKVAYIFSDNGEAADDPGYVPGEVHGIIAATADQGTAVTWWNGTGTTTGATATALGTGSANTTMIIGSTGNNGSYAAKLCRDYTDGTYHDWYLPSQDELNKLYLKMSSIGGFESNYYWSSTEFSAANASNQYFSSETVHNQVKTSTYHVRAIRAF